jgi:PIN domain nuclease of toxin-antitoxin system
VQYLLDACAILALFNNEEGSELEAAAAGEFSIYWLK